MVGDDNGSHWHWVFTDGSWSRTVDDPTGTCIKYVAKLNNAIDAYTVCDALMEKINKDMRQEQV
jgi:hypothetical protein